MSLDARIRQLAAEAVAEAGGGDGAAAARVAELEKQVADQQAQLKDLHDHLHRALTTIQRMEKRLDALEKTTGQTNQESRPAARRTSRKESTE